MSIWAVRFFGQKTRLSKIRKFAAEVRQAPKEEERGADSKARGKFR